MKLLSLQFLFACLTVAIPFEDQTSPPPPYDTFDNVTVFTAPSNWTNKGTWYGRIVLLNQNCEEDNVILSTWSFNAPNKTYLPIYKSLDLGRTWAPFSKIYFKTAGYSSIAQPFLYETSEQFGTYPPGTILATGNIFANRATAIELHASRDKGLTWEYITTVAKGGAPTTNDGGTSIWEPFIMAHDHQLGVFYSDSRDPKHSQKLVHQTSTDLLTWSEPVDDAANANYSIRPGMTSITQMGNGKFIFAYEVDKVPGFPAYAHQPVFVRIADSPFEFANVTEHPVVASDGEVASSAPQIVWTPAGGPNGTLVLSGSHEPAFFLNTALGDPSAWVRVEVGHGVGYSRALQIIPNTMGKVILVFNGGMFSGNTGLVSAGDYVVPGPGSDLDNISNCPHGSHLHG